MAGRLTQQELRDEVHAMCRRGGINPADVTVVFPASLEAEHCRNLRRYAQVDLDATRFEFATSVLELPDVYREAVIAHEVGHVLAGGASSEADADRAALEVLGVEIDYDRAWPGKGLQMKINPFQTSDDAEHAFIKAMRDPDPNSTEVAQDIALESGLSLVEISQQFTTREEALALLRRRGGWLRSTILAYGAFTFDPPNRARDGEFDVQWVVYEKDGVILAVIGYRYGAGGDGGEAVGTRKGYAISSKASEAAMRAAWAAFAIMKEATSDAITFGQYRSRLNVFLAERAGEVPKEINPSRSSTEAIDAFDKAMIDPDPSSTAVAQDIAEENGLKLRDLGARHRKPGWGELKPDPRWGRFWFAGSGREGQAMWAVVLPRERHETPYVIFHWRRDDAREPQSPSDKWPHARITMAQRPVQLDQSVYVQRMADYGAAVAWHTLANMKEHYDDPELDDLIRHDLNDRAIPDALRGPSMPKKNPDDLERARDKYEEFHRYAPKKEIFERSFKIPTRMREAGKSKWVTYRSGKVDPATLKKPKKPVDYIHEHDAGVHTYLPDDPDTDVPSSYRQVDALVKLGENLGFCFVDHDGETIEAEGQGKLPELYTTPDGKCLLVIQDRKKVLAMIWGGGLGVFARGIDG